MTYGYSYFIEKKAKIKAKRLNQQAFLIALGLVIALLGAGTSEQVLSNESFWLGTVISLIGAGIIILSQKLSNNKGLS